eukprot:TRINITY_DN32638_c0_g1_i2.p1 TRINITY_DN32638_c0_g1~~TRINITY_DN32638_c0_g1_i2.p1  ORF type:complete len:255 (+),score=51.51 TRINITY_DN32638_c0_g1_i2:35-766(+)
MATTLEKSGIDADQKEAEELKERGNRLMKAKDSRGALRCYSEAISLLKSWLEEHAEEEERKAQERARIEERMKEFDDDSSEKGDETHEDGSSSNGAPGRGLVTHDILRLAVSLYANSAQACLNQRLWLEAIDHCNHALRFDPAHTKSSFRGATAAIEVAMHEVAIAFADGGLAYSPCCPELLELRKKLGPLPESPRQLPPGGGGGSDDEIDLKIWRLPTEREKASKRMELRRGPQPPGKEKGD